MREERFKFSRLNFHYSRERDGERDEEYHHHQPGKLNSLKYLIENSNALCINTAGAVFATQVSQLRTLDELIFGLRRAERLNN